MILEWSRAAHSDAPRPLLFLAGDMSRSSSWRSARPLALALVATLMVPLLLVGVQARFVFGTTVCAALLCLAAMYLTNAPATPTEALLSRLTRWGAFWLLLGLVLDPAENGTHKVPPTLAWFFQGCGLAIFVLMVFFIIVHVMERRGWVQARQETERVSGELSARYVRSVDPYQVPR